MRRKYRSRHDTGRRGGADASDSDSEEEEGGRADAAAAGGNLLTYSKLTEGMRLWGVVMSLPQAGVVKVLLPNNIEAQCSSSGGSVAERAGAGGAATGSGSTRMEVVRWPGGGGGR